MNTYKRLNLADREEISRGIWTYESFASIARRIGRPTSAVSREVWRNNRYKWRYFASKAQQKADLIQRKGRRPKKLDTNERLRDYVYDKLLNHQWSPEEIAKRMKLEYPHEVSMRISHETIYRHLYCLPRGELKSVLMKGLRQERKMGQPRRYAHCKRQRIQNIISISERPMEVKKRIVPGHWEGDLIIGKGHQSAIGTLVERTTRFTLLVPLKEKNAYAVRRAMAKAFKRIPKEMKKSLTYDRGTEMSQHKLFTRETKIRVFFADPYSLWQRGTNENTNGLIRQYFPKGSDLSQVSVGQMRAVEQKLNSRPRKVLGFYTPSEKFYALTTGQNIALES